MGSFGLYSHIRANYVRSVILLIGLFVQVYVVAFAIALLFTALQGDAAFTFIIEKAWHTFIAWLPYATGGAILWIGIATAFQRRLIRAISGHEGLERQDAPELYNMLENLCISRGTPMPRLAILDDEAPNAFASGIDHDTYEITLTTGLIAMLDDDEIEAVLAHELTHIHNHDVRLMVFAFIIVGMIGFVVDALLRRVFLMPGRSNGRNGSGGALIAIVLAFALVAFSWFLAQVMNFALSRRREYLADAGAVELTKNPDAMISALRKVAGLGDVDALPNGMMELCFDNPRTGFQSLFASHPATEKRIEALVEKAGGRVQAAPAISRTRVAGSLEARMAQVTGNRGAQTGGHGDGAGDGAADGGRHAGADKTVQSPWAAAEASVHPAASGQHGHPGQGQPTQGQPGAFPLPPFPAGPSQAGGTASTMGPLDRLPVAATILAGAAAASIPSDPPRAPPPPSPSPPRSTAPPADRTSQAAGPASGPAPAPASAGTAASVVAGPVAGPWAAKPAALPAGHAEAVTARPVERAAANVPPAAAKTIEPTPPRRLPSLPAVARREADPAAAAAQPFGRRRAKPMRAAKLHSPQEVS